MRGTLLAPAFWPALCLLICLSNPAAGEPLRFESLAQPMADAAPPRPSAPARLELEADLSWVFTVGAAGDVAALPASPSGAARLALAEDGEGWTSLAAALEIEHQHPEPLARRIAPGATELFAPLCLTQRFGPVSLCPFAGGLLIREREDEGLCEFKGGCEVGLELPLSVAAGCEWESGGEECLVSFRLEWPIAAGIEVSAKVEDIGDWDFSRSPPAFALGAAVDLAGGWRAFASAGKDRAGIESERLRDMAYVGLMATF
jgi:hypothetical protein